MTPAELTSEDMARLLVGLDALPGLDPTGLVVATWSHYVRGDATPDGRGMYWGRDRDGLPLVLVRSPEGLNVRVVARAAVNLADRSSRNRVAEQLADRVGLEVGCTAPWWKAAHAFGLRTWELWSTNSNPDMRWFRADWGKDSGRDGKVSVPALAEVHADDRRLPDGSRYDDALALALVAAGSAP